MRSTTDTFDDNQVPTIGGSFASKTFQIGSDQIVVRIWDTAGQERFRSLASMYYQEAHCAILVFSVLALGSFKEITYWVNELKENYETLPVLCVVGNMVDESEGRAVSYADGQELAKSVGAKYFETSAKTGEGIDEMFMAVATEIAKVVKNEDGEKGIDLEGSTTKKGCC